MGVAIGQVLPLGIGFALSPLPIIAVVIMLGTPRAKSNGPAFLAGWLLGLALVGTIVLILAGGANASEDGEPATWVSWVKLGLGVLLVLFAAKTWRSQPADGESADMPKWMKAIDSFSSLKSTAVGAVLAAVNPKNLMLSIAAGTTIAQTGIATGQQVVAFAVFAVIGTLGVGIPVAIYFLLGERAADLLGKVKDWMTLHNAAIMTVLLTILGVKLIGDAIPGLG